MLKLNATKELLDGSLPIINLFVSIVFFPSEFPLIKLKTICRSVFKLNFSTIKCHSHAKCFFFKLKVLISFNVICTM